MAIASAFMAIAFVLLLIDGDASLPFLVFIGAASVLMAIAAWTLRRQESETSDA